ncbi:hypothetical protein ACU4GH_04285 [Bradyrhizobium betae]
MRMVEAGVLPVITHPHVQGRNREVTPMSDYAYGDRQKIQGGDKSVETRVMFGACYMAFLFRAVVARLTPWRKRAGFDQSRNGESIFTEARIAAGTIVTSSFMGL